MEIQCIECGEKFALTEGEINFYDKKDYPYPKRCKNCRNSSMFDGLKLKQNSFFNNAKQFGMPTNVSGGLDIEYKFIINCSIDNVNKYILIDYSDGKKRLKLTNYEQRATKMTKDEAERIVKLISEKKNISSIKVLSKSHYVSKRL